MRLHDAARAFAAAAFGERFPYVFALHDEGGHPHVHLTVRALGVDDSRLNPRKADLEVWRQRFAQALRDRGVEAEASPRRARGVPRKAERTAVRKMRERHLEKGAPAPRVMTAVYEANNARMGAAAPWEKRQWERQARIGRALTAEAIALSRSARPEDRGLGAALIQHMRRLPKDRSRESALSRIIHERRPEEDHRRR